jgi:hypothetical protein
MSEGRGAFLSGSQPSAARRSLLPEAVTMTASWPGTAASTERGGRYRADVARLLSTDRMARRA